MTRRRRVVDLVRARRSLRRLDDLAEAHPELLSEEARERLAAELEEEAHAPPSSNVTKK